MRKLLKYFFTIGIAVLTFAACEEEEQPTPNPINYTLVGDTAFNSELKANFKVVADRAAEEDVTVNIILDDGSTFKESQLTFPATVQIAKGDKEASATIAIKDRLALDAGVEYLAVLAAVVNDVKSVQKVVLKYSRPDLQGKWSAIGTLAETSWDTDFVLTEGEGGWYSVAGVEAYEGAKFKFRRGGSWDDINFGGEYAEGEFAVTKGGADIALPKEGVYTLALNPNAEKAKVTRTGDIVREYAISAPEAFDENLKATIKVTCNKPVAADVVVALAKDADKTVMPEGVTLTIPENITIEKGKKEGSADIELATLPKYCDFSVVVNLTNGDLTVPVALKCTVLPKAMTIADIKALCTQTSNVEFEGLFTGMYVNYVLSNQHIYLEDESGAIRFYLGSGNTLKVGDKLSGVIVGKCLKDGNGRPQISVLDWWTYPAKKEVAPEDEMPKPVTVKLADVAENYDNLLFRRVKMEGVVLRTDSKSGAAIGITDPSGSFKLWLNNAPSPVLPAGSRVSFTGTFDMNTSAKFIKVFQTSEIAALKPSLVKLWGVYTSGSTLWTTNVQAISITHPDGYGMARSLAMDDEYIYLPKSSAYPAIAAVKIADPTGQVKGNVSGVDAGDTFKTSFVRIMKNTDASVNGGKDVLLMSNLSAANGGNIVIYAYTNGITEAPIKLAQFAWDSANNVEDWRRYGDRFFVTGTWQNGKIYLPSFNANKSVILSVANGARTAVTQIAAGENSPEGIKDMTVYPGDTKLFIHNNAVANLVAPTGGKSSQGWDEYTLSASSAKGVGTWGYHFFKFDGKDYIAYARLADKKAWIEVIEDKGDLLTSLAAQDGLLMAPLHSASSLDTELATGNLADCTVREIGGVVYIAGLSRDGGAAVFKMVK